MRAIEFSSSINESSNFSHCFELVDFIPVYTKTEINNKGEILGTKGIGMWAGYYKKNYYKPVELNKWNTALDLFNDLLVRVLTKQRKT